MIEKTYKIPEESEEIIDNLVKVGIERFYRQAFVKPVEEQNGFQVAIDKIMVENEWDKVYNAVEESTLLSNEEVINEKTQP